eukprot:TRINITY_DN6649_c0_g1_i1.p1 TRINITY_DN6649_c0_g1~~TRINITY_DN6649_c0_g1_i1.p1  ORF type:complete len:387 (-),score=60.43 TRINITY_DN6649_c0_g1_i1:220-1380(-)
MAQVWNLAILDYRLRLEENATRGTGDSGKIAELLQAASKLIGRTQPLTSQELHKTIDYVMRYEEENMGAFQSIYGLFTFVNTIWVIACVGIAVSIGPTLWHILKPFRELLWRISLFVVEEIILRFHRWGVWELCAYLVSSGFIVEGIRHQNSRGFFISLMGVLLVAPTYCYSTLLHAKIKTQGSTSKYLFKTGLVWCSIWWIMMTCKLESYFLGWISVGTFFTYIFLFIYDIFYRNNEDSFLFVCSLSSGILLAIWMVARISPGTPYALFFATPVSIFGCVVLNMSLMTHSSWFWTRRQFYHFLLYQLPFLGVLVSEMAIGTFFSLHGMTNMSIVFLILWAFLHYVEFHLEFEFNIWVLVFILSGCVWWIALWLHSHPEFVRNMFL